MSDDNEHEHEHHHPMPFVQFLVGPTPEEQERMHLNALANAHELHHFFDSLNENQLMKLVDFTKIVSFNEAAAYYYIGILAHKLDVDHGKCMACGKKHDDELADLVGDGGPAESVDPDTPAVKGTKKYDELMYLYNMEQDDDGSDRVMCKGCGLWYTNLADRMLRKADKSGCTGCVQKEQWG